MFSCDDKAGNLHVRISNERSKSTRKFYGKKEIYSCLNKMTAKLSY